MKSSLKKTKWRWRYCFLILKFLGKLEELESSVSFCEGKYLFNHNVWCFEYFQSLFQNDDIKSFYLFSNEKNVKKPNIYELKQKIHIPVALHFFFGKSRKCVEWFVFQQNWDFSWLFDLQIWGTNLRNIWKFGRRPKTSNDCFHKKYKVTNNRHLW
jgi:hypothetical protein